MLRPSLGRLWASQNGASRRDPGTPKYLLGWISEIPTYQVLNYLQYKQDTTMLALAERGIFEWGTDVTYKKGALVWDEVDSKIYIAKIASPGTTRPGLNSNWEASSVQIGRALFDQTKTNIDNHIAATNNPHGLLPGTIGTYSKAEVNVIVNNYYAQVAAHASRKDNPHSTTAKDVGAVPSTGGTYTGDVTFQVGKIFLSADKVKYAGYVDAGIWLRDGQAGVGILDTGVPVAKDTAGVSSEILTEKSFPKYKAQVEPNYVSPEPFLYIPFCRDINIYTGSGTLDYSDSDDIPAYNNNLLNWNADGTTKAIVTDQDSLIGVSAITIAIDFIVQGAQAGTSTLVGGINVGVRGTDIEVVLINTTQSTGRAELWKAGTRLAQTPDIPFTRDVLGRVVVVASQSSLKVYGNGVLRATAPTVAWGAFNTSSIRMSTTVRNPSYSQSIGNFRIWNSALTDAQVSAL